MRPIDIPVQDEVSIADFRDAIAKCIDALDTGAIVHNNWEFKYNWQETVDYLTPTGSNVVHAWLVSVSEINEESVLEGGDVLYLPLTVKIWGLIGYEYGTSNESRQATLEKECLQIIKVLYMNRLHFGMDNAENFDKVGTLTFDEIDVKAWGTGNDILVAQGQMEVRWKTLLQKQN